MKKKIISVILLLLITLFSTVTQVDAEELSHDDLAFNYFQAMGQMKDEWKEATIDEVVILKGQDDAKLYRVYQEDEQQGYFIVSILNEKLTVTEATLSGEDPLQTEPNKNYYVAPFGFYIEDEYQTVIEKINQQKEMKGFTLQASLKQANIQPMGFWPWTDPLKEKYLVPVPDSYVYTYYGTYSSEQKVLMTPEYYDYPVGPVINGSGPTTAAMLTAFYDRVALTNLISGSLPLNHYDNPTAVNNHIRLMAQYLKTCNDLNGDLTNPTNCEGTTHDNALEGIMRYFAVNGNSGYRTYYNTDIDDYIHLILNGNPVYLRIIDPTYYNGRAVLGVGRTVLRYGGPQLIVRYNMTSKSGEFYVAEEFFNGFIYVSRG